MARQCHSTVNSAALTALFMTIATPCTVRPASTRKPPSLTPTVVWRLPAQQARDPLRRALLSCPEGATELHIWPQDNPNLAPRFAASSHGTWRTKAYVPSSAFDGNHRTAWVEGRKDDGLGEWFSMEFPGKRAVMHAFVLLPGFAKNPGMFRRNNRPTRIRCDLACRQRGEEEAVARSYLLEPRDLRAVQLFALAPQDRVTLRGTCLFRATLEAIKRGTHYRDTCVAELQLVVRPAAP